MEKYINIKLHNITSNSEAFTGEVINSYDNWNHQHVIGLVGVNSVVVDDVLEFQPINQVSILPSELKLNLDKVLNNLKPLTLSLLCDYLYLKTNDNEVIIIISPSWEDSISYVQWILLKNAYVIIYIPKLDDENILSKWSRHPFFKHQSFKNKTQQIMLRSINCTDLSSDILKVTGGYGASGILILDGSVTAFSTDQMTLHRQILLSCGIGSRVVWCSELDQVDPCECQCLFSKGVSLSFFNPNAILNTNAFQGILQHSIILFLKHILNHSLFLT